MQVILLKSEFREKSNRSIMVLKCIAYPLRDFPCLPSSSTYNNRLRWGSFSLFYTWRHSNSQRLLLPRVTQLGHSRARAQPHLCMGHNFCPCHLARWPRGRALLTIKGIYPAVLGIVCCHSRASNMWLIYRTLICALLLRASTPPKGRGSQCSYTWNVTFV